MAALSSTPPPFWSSARTIQARLCLTEDSCGVYRECLSWITPRQIIPTNFRRLRLPLSGLVACKRMPRVGEQMIRMRFAVTWLAGASRRQERRNAVWSAAFVMHSGWSEAPSHSFVGRDGWCGCNHTTNLAHLFRKWGSNCMSISRHTNKFKWEM